MAAGLLKKTLLPLTTIPQMPKRTTQPWKVPNRN